MCRLSRAVRDSSECGESLFVYMGDITLSYVVHMNDWPFVTHLSCLFRDYIDAGCVHK